jgi:hypothetical protein
LIERPRCGMLRHLRGGARSAWDSRPRDEPTSGLQGRRPTPRPPGAVALHFFSNMAPASSLGRVRCGHDDPRLQHIRPLCGQSKLVPMSQCFISPINVQNQEPSDSLRTRYGNPGSRVLCSVAWRQRPRGPARCQKVPLFPRRPDRRSARVPLNHPLPHRRPVRAGRRRVATRPASPGPPPLTTKDTKNTTGTDSSAGRFGDFFVSFVFHQPVRPGRAGPPIRFRVIRDFRGPSNRPAARPIAGRRTGGV